MSDQPANVYQKIAGIMADLGPIEKTGNNSFQKYRFITAELLFATLQKKLATAGLVVVPTIDSITLSPGSKTENLLATMRIRVVNADNPADFFEMPWFAQGGAGDDKGVNKCATSGMKYALMRLFLISDEEDPDADSPTPEKPKTATTKPAAPARQTTDQRGDYQASHGPITHAISPDGKKKYSRADLIAQNDRALSALGAGMPTLEQADWIRMAIALCQQVAPTFDTTTPADLPTDELASVLRGFTLAIRALEDA